MRHAGCGWPNGPVSGGNSHILSLPSPDLLMLGSEHWHVVEAQNAGKRVLFRGMARPGYRPAELNWDASDYVREITRDLERLPPGTVKQFVAWNELNLQDERGDHEPDHGDLTAMMTRIGRFTRDVVILLRRKYPGVELHYGAFAPKDECDYVDLWRAAAESCDVIDVHAYGHGVGIVGHIDKYAGLFPNHPIHLTEWHSDFEGVEADRDTLALLANYAAVHQDFRAYYFLWRWDGAPAHQRDLARAIAIESNGSRMALFLSPPQAAPLPEPIPEPEPAMPDPWEHWTADRIAEATDCPVAAVTNHWPRIVEQLDHCGINDHMVQVAMAGTLAIETASTFAPVREAFWLDEAWRQNNLRYYPYYGRGYIQLTWESNYQTYGPKIAELWGTSPDQPDFDLAGEPDRALDPDIAAAVAALYFRDHGGGAIPVAARAGDWREVRRLVQGGADGLDRLMTIAADLTGQAPPVATERSYGGDIPDGVVRQQNSWTCAVRSTYAALWAMAQQGHGPAVTYGDGGPRDVYDWMVPTYDAPNVGLLDHTGAGLAAMLRSHGYAATSYYPVTLATVRELAGAQPCLIGGDQWNHWAMVRGRTNDGGLILENPMPGHAGIIDYVRDSWDRLGPMALVTLDLVPVVEPAPPDAGQPSYDQLANLEGVSYHEDGVVIPALEGARATGDWSQVDAVVKFLRSNDPHRAA